jgi:hypothetical protein
VIIETHVDMLDVSGQRWRFTPATGRGDATNWCGPNPAMV